MRTTSDTINLSLLIISTQWILRKGADFHYRFLIGTILTSRAGSKTGQAEDRKELTNTNSHAPKLGRNAILVFKWLNSTLQYDSVSEISVRSQLGKRLEGNRPIK